LAIFKQEHAYLARICRSLQDHCAKPAQWADEFRRKGAHRFNLLHLRVERGGGFKFEICRSMVALAAQRNQLAFTTRGQKALNRRGLFCVALVAAAFEARREAHLHLGVNAARITGVGVKLKGASAQEKKLQHLFREALGGGARRKRPVGPIGFAQARPVGDRDARIGIAAKKAHKCRRAQMHPLKTLRAVLVLEQIELEKQRFEL
jgi:hypothetical protein